MDKISLTLIIIAALASNMVSDIFIRPVNETQATNWDGICGVLIAFGVIGLIVCIAVDLIARYYRDQK